MKKNGLMYVVVIILVLVNMGCIHHNGEESIDILQYSLTLEDIPNDFKKMNEEHITKPYTVAKGKLLEGIEVEEKYEVYYIKNVSEFIIQQIALLSSHQQVSQFMNTLSSDTSIPGMQNDWNFSEVPVESVGDNMTLLKNETTIDGNNVTIYLLAFHIERIVNILVSSSIVKDDLINYAEIIEGRINEV